MYKREGPTALVIYTHSVTVTEFATIINHATATRVECPTVAELGFAQGASRSMVYGSCKRQGLGAMQSAVAVKVLQITRSGDGVLHVATGWGETTNDPYFYGFFVDWPEGNFRCRHDIASPEEILPLDHRVVLARRSFR